ncbi:hypothetical protein [Halarchaeum nitratireducens]|uniref:Uncharacterized protein n=1 Tax=Halarchaeum nitratireducens TaxID=489913 RepID=A0A830GE07_9EURY|nr:hypothetical protein [Halarchaeum nitratireducens]GGN24746.1 hypothetical protein GCM10009021_28260 [Halarchaeum nitratireducens]
MQGTTLVVEVDASADVDHVNLVKPNDSLFGKRSLAAGAHRVSFDVGTAYSPGTYKVVAVNKGKSIATVKRSLRPNLEIEKMGVGRNHPSKMWNGTSHKSGDEAFVVVKNNGSGPSAVTKLLFQGAVPYPSGENGTNYADDPSVSGIYDPSTDAETQQVVVPPGERKTIYSDRSPFGFVPGVGTNCKSDPQNGTFTVSITGSVRDSSTSQTYQIHYSASESFNNCSIKIGEQ